MSNGSKSAWVLSGVLTVALLAVGYWLWPEAQRTLRMHRM